MVLRHPILKSIPPSTDGDKFNEEFKNFQYGLITQDDFIFLCMSQALGYLRYLYTTGKISYTIVDEAISLISLDIVKFSHRTLEDFQQVQNPVAYILNMVKHAISNIYRESSKEILSSTLDTQYKTNVFIECIDLIDTLCELANDQLDIDILRLRTQNKTTREIGEKLGIAHTTVSLRLVNLHDKYLSLQEDL